MDFIHDLLRLIMEANVVGMVLLNDSIDQTMPSIHSTLRLLTKTNLTLLTPRTALSISRSNIRLEAVQWSHPQTRSQLQHIPFRRNPEQSDAASSSVAKNNKDLLQASHFPTQSSRRPQPQSPESGKEVFCLTGSKYCWTVACDGGGVIEGEEKEGVWKEG